MSREKGISQEEKVRKAVRSMVADMIPVQSREAEVKSVDADKRTCVVVDTDDLEWEDVLLGVAEGEGNWNKPTVGSMVMISIINNIDGAAYVSMFSEVDEVYMNCKDGAKFSLQKDGNVYLNGDSFGGLVKLDELESNLDALKKYVETMNSAIGPAFSAVGAAMSANGAAGKTSYDTAMVGQSINFQNMENDKVKHGDG